jgi:NitT/TauT family transport system permease protein
METDAPAALPEPIIAPPSGATRSWVNTAQAALVFVIFLTLWRLAIGLFKVPPYLLPTPWQVALSVVHDRAKLINAFWITGQEAGGGLLGSFVLGVIGAIIFAQWRWVRRLLYPYTLLLQTVPILVVTSLILTWFGNGLIPIMMIAIIICTFPIMANATQGLVSVERNLRELFAMHNASSWQILWKLKLPHALPSLFTGLRISSGLSVIGAITGELFAGSNQVGVGGLGYSITYASSQMQTDYLFALALMCSLLGFTFFFATLSLEWLFLHHWHESAIRADQD